MSNLAVGTVSKASPADRKLIPFVDLKAQFETIRVELSEAVMRTLESQRVILGPEVEAFESEIAHWNSSRFAVGCASGSDALLLSLMALDIGPGDEVITTPFTFVATVTAIVRLGATPVFADIDPSTFNLRPEKVAAAITSRSKAVIPVHLFGLSADVAPMLDLCRSHGLAMVEDAAQAIGATYHGEAVGNMGALGCFSFYPSKNLGCAGDGGLITTNDESLADRLRVLRTHGSRTPYNYELIGINSRLDALQAAILRVKLRHLQGWTAGRRANAARYNELLSAAGLLDRIVIPHAPAHSYHIYNQYTLRCPKRDGLRAHLLRYGIPGEIYYPKPLHLQTAYSYLGYRPGDFPESERAAAEVLSLPIYPELPENDLLSVVNAIADFYRD